MGASDLESLLRPHSLAIVGASKDVTKMGGRCVKYALRHEFPGNLYLVNRSGGEIAGRQALTSIDELPAGVDCALLAVSSDQLMSALDACASRGVRSAIILASGFAESGEDGRRLQERVTAFARETGIRLCGPNSNGLVNTYGRTVATSNPTLEADLLQGNVAVVSQSGGLGLGSILYLGQQHGIGFSFHISSGNEADVEAADYVDYLLDDPRTDVIALLIEGWKTPQKVLDVAHKAADFQKPVILLKLGRTARGGRLAASHTALLTGSDKVQRAILGEVGIIHVDDFDDLYEVASAFGAHRSNTAVPTALSDHVRDRGVGSGIAVVSPSGGAAILSADVCEGLDLPLAELSSDTVEELAATLPSYATIQNPLDLTAVGTSDPAIYPACAQALLADPRVTSLVAVLTVNVNYDPLMRTLVQMARSTTKPVVCIGVGDGLSGRGFRILEEGGVPLFRNFHKGLGALARLTEYRGFLQQRGPAVARTVSSSTSISGPHLAGPQSEATTKRLLAEFGIAVTREAVVQSEAAAVVAAEDIGWPVALKVMSPTLLHKTEAGVLRLGLSDATQLQAAYRDLVHTAEQLNVASSVEGILVQEMVPRGVEVMIGVITDPQWGPVITFGLGGVLVELIDDVALGVPPLDEARARSLIEKTRASALLHGIRGGSASDISALAEMIVQVSEMAEQLGPDLQELDLNPVMVLPAGFGACVVDAMSVFQPQAGA